MHAACTSLLLEGLTASARQCAQGIAILKVSRDQVHCPLSTPSSVSSFRGRLQTQHLGFSIRVTEVLAAASIDHVVSFSALLHCAGPSHRLCCMM